MTKLSRIALAHLGAAMLLLTPAAHAAPCSETGLVPGTPTLHELINGCTIEDKLFAGFTALLGPTDVSASLTLTGAPVIDPLLIGFSLALPFPLPIGVDFTAPLVIGYTVTVLDPLFLITDIHLGLIGGTGGLVTEQVTSGITVNQLLKADYDPSTLDIGTTAAAFFSGVSTLAVVKTITDLHVFSDGGRIVQQVSQTAVPEPASLALLGLGLTGLAVARRRKQN